MATVEEVDTETRYVSHSEIRALLACHARWDFAYDEQVAGFRMKPHRIPALMSDGRAYGEAVAVYHMTGDKEKAKLALKLHLAGVAKKQINLGPLGGWDEDVFVETNVLLNGILENHMNIKPPMFIEQLEERFTYPIIKGYAFHGNIDGLVLDPDGSAYIIDFKLRTQFSHAADVQRDRQFIRYAWLYWKCTGQKLTGIIVDETLKAVPNPPKINKDGSVSKRQSCTAAEYVAACEERGQDPLPEIVEYLNKKVWHYTHTIYYTNEDYEVCERELKSACILIEMLRRKHMFPIRNTIKSNCVKCLFNSICDDPDNEIIIDQDYKKLPPRKLGQAFEEDIATTHDELDDKEPESDG